MYSIILKQLKENSFHLFPVNHVLELVRTSKEVVLKFHQKNTEQQQAQQKSEKNRLLRNVLSSFIPEVTARELSLSTYNKFLQTKWYDDRKITSS